ncbi:MAG: lysophospholipid acyltransferase family protein [Ilumatobacteraceae bacterium]
MARPRTTRSIPKLVTTLMVRAFFRRVEIDGVERLPTTGPVITVANHANGLVDGLLLMSTLPRWPRFLGKATLFDIAPLRPFLQLTGVIPVHRTKDETAGEPNSDRAAKNDATFAACRELLRGGEMVSIFPEGISHDHNSLQPLRTGTARIALSAAFDAEPTAGHPSRATGLDIVPIGLAYDAKATFRSHAVIVIGDPIPVDQWSEAYAADPRATVRTCTAAITEGLRAVAPDHPLGGSLDDPSRRLRLVAVLRRASRAEPRAVLAVAAPVAFIGTVVHVVPYQIVKLSARLPRNESIKSTVKLLGSTVLFVTEWTAMTAVAWRTRGKLAAAVTAVAAPLSGYVAVRFAETIRDSTSEPGVPDSAP